MGTDTEVSGSIAPGYEPIRAAFEENIATRGEVGAAVSVWHRGREVANLAGGVVAPDGAPYGLDTLQLTGDTNFSTPSIVRRSITTPRQGLPTEANLDSELRSRSRRKNSISAAR